MLNENVKSTPSMAHVWLAMLGVGVAWGATPSLGKIAVAGGLHPIGLTIWQTAIAALVMSAVVQVTRRRFPVTRAYLLFYLGLGILNIALPHPLLYYSTQHLPVSIIAIVLAGVPLTTLLLATFFGLDRPNLRRMTGLVLGFVAIVIVALPKGADGQSTSWLWLGVLLLVVFCFAGVAVYMDKLRLPGMDPVVTLCGMSWAGLIILSPWLVMPGVGFGWFPTSQAHFAALTAFLLHVFAAYGMIWLVREAGAVFANQISYIRTLSGVLIAVVFLSEPASLTILLSLALMLLGLALVKPKRNA